MEAPKLNRTEPSDIAFRDPLSEETRKVRTHLLFVGALAALVKAYDLRITKAPWLDLDVPANAPQILEGAISVALCYLLFVFVLYGWQDFKRWRLAGEIQLVYASFDLILHSREDLRVISLHIEKLDGDQGLHSAVRRAVETAAERLPASQAELVALRSNLRRLNWLQWFRVVVIEAALPILLGGFALFKVNAALGPFLGTVVR